MKQFQGIRFNTYDGLKNHLDFPDPLPLHDIPLEFGKYYSAMITVQPEEFIHQIGNDRKLVRFADCLTWKELTSDVDKCTNKCLPVILGGLYGELGDVLRCHDTNQYQCMMDASLDKLVSLTVKIV